MNTKPSVSMTLGRGNDLKPPTGSDLEYYGSIAEMGSLNRKIAGDRPILQINFSEELEFRRENRVEDVNAAASLLNEIAEDIDPKFIAVFLTDLREALSNSDSREDALVDVLSGWFSTARLSKTPEMSEALKAARESIGEVATNPVQSKK